jgi:hypothetical protein
MTRVASLGALPFAILLVVESPSLALAARGDCAQPMTDGARPMATDCLAILKDAVGVDLCLPECACRVRGQDEITATDALACLVASVGGAAELACACRDDDLVVLTRLALDLRPVRRDDGIPEGIDLFLALTADGTGTIGAAESEEVFVASVAPVRWMRVDDVMHIEAGRLDLWQNAYFSWARILLDLVDASTGAGSVERGYVEVLWGDAYSWTIIFHAGVPASFDADDPVLRLWQNINIDTPFVGDTFTVNVSEPVRADELEGRVRLLADGVPVATTIDVVDRVGEFATRLEITPVDYLGFEVELGLDAGGLRDAVKREATWDGRSWMTMADPGPASANPGFDLLDPYLGYGWFGADLGAFEYPSNGEPVDYHVALATTDFDRMLGYFDLPPDATALEFTAALDGGCFVEYCVEGVAVYVLVPGERRPAFIPTFEPQPTGEYSDCYSEVYSIPETRVRTDIADLAGRRVYVYAHAFWDWPCDLYVLRLDDFTIVRASNAE